MAQNHGGQTAFLIPTYTNLILYSVFNNFSRNHGNHKHLEKKNSKMADSKKLSFSNPPILNIFPPQFQRLVLRYIKYIDAKGNDVVQTIWLSDCPM